MADYTPKYVNPTEANRYGSKSTRITKPQSTAGAYQNVNAGEAQRYITSQNQLGGQTFNLRYGGVDYTLDQSQIGWMQDRYKKSFDSYYKNTVEDSQRLLSGAMPTAFERSYGSNQLDQQLYSMGLPSSKYLGSMMKDYSDWYGDGATYQFDDQASKYITDEFKKTWKYEYTTEDQARKVKGLMPLALEQSYADSYTDEQLKKAGLPPSMKLSDFTTPYEERVATQNRMQDFYLAVGAEVFDMKARRGVENDSQKYDDLGVGFGYAPKSTDVKDAFEIEQTSGTQLWQDTFYNMLEKPEWADVAALYKQTKTADDLDPGKYDDNAAYREARIKAINSENKAAASTDLSITYDDFISQYNTKLERQFRALKIVDDATAAAKGETVTYGDYADAMDAQRKSETYAGITDRATARQYAETAFSSDPNADPTAILRGMYDGGVDFKHIRQAKNRLMEINSGTENKAVRDGISAAYDTLNTANTQKQQAASKEAANKSTSFIDAALEYFVSGMLAQNAGTAQGSSRDIAMSASKEASGMASETLSRATAKADKIRKDALVAADIIDGYYGSAFTTVSKDDATKAFKSYIKYDGKNIDPDSLDAAKAALADMGLTNYEIGVIEESVESDEQSGVGKFLMRLLYPDSGVDNTQVNTINQGYDWAATQQYNASRSGKGAKSDLSELMQIARKRVTAEGIMSNYDFDQAIRVNGQSGTLDPTESARNYYLEVEAPKSGATPEQAAQMWASWTPEFQAQYTDWFSGSSMSNPEVAKSMDEVIAYQGIGSIAPKVVAGLANSAVGLADMTASFVDGRSDTWDFTKDVQDFTSYISNYGRTNQSLATQGISAASDIGAEIARMYLLNAAGGALLGNGSKLATAASSATSKGMRTLAKVGAYTVKSSPFILNAMGGYYNEATQGGASIDQARSYALVMGALEGFTESWQTDAIWGKVLGKNMSASIAKSAGKTFSSGMLTKAKFINLAASFLGEATEEGASYAGSWLMSAKLQGWNEQPFSVEELAKQSLMGGFIGMLGGALSLPSMNEARITAEYMSKSGNYNTEYQDILVSAMFANSMPESFKEQAIAQGYKAILPIAEYKSAFENVNQSREQLINGEKQHAQDMDAMQQAFEKRVKPSEKAERMLDLLRMDGVDPASEEFSRARESLLKYGTVEEATTKHNAAVQKATDSYAAVKQQQNRAIEKSMEKVRAHHAVLADLFADDIAYMAEKTAADTADNQNYKQFAYAMQRIDELTQQGITSGAEYEAAVEALGQSQQLRDRIFDLRTKTENRGVTTPEKMRAARAGNAEAFVKKNKPANSKSKVINATEAEAKQTVSESEPAAQLAPDTAAAPQTSAETTTAQQPSPETMYAVDQNAKESVNAIRQIARTAQKYIVSGTAGIDRFARTVQKKIAVGAVTSEDLAQGVRSAPGVSQYILNDRLADVNGTTIGDSFASLFKDIPDELWGEYQLYTLARHNESRMTLEERGFGDNKPVLASDTLDPDGKPIPMSASESAALAEQIEAAHPEFAQTFENQKRWWADFMKSWAVDGGLMSEYLYDELAAKYPDYVPTHRVDVKNVGSRPVVTSSEIQSPSIIREAKGSLKDVQDIRTSMADLVQRYVAMERYNELVQNMYNFAETHVRETSEYAAIITEPGGKPTDVDFHSFDELAIQSATEVKDGQYIVRGWRDGERIAMSVNQDIYDGFNSLLNPADVSMTSKAVNGVTKFLRKITKPIKNLLTGYNPSFGVRNLVRDAGTYVVNTEANAVDTFANVARAVTERSLNSDLWQSYQAMGGKASGFISSQQIGRVDATIRGKFKQIMSKAGQVTGAVGGYTENMWRFAEYIEGIRQFGDTPEGRRKATQMAADVTVNFSRSAPATKAIDSACIYFNANVQGLDKFARRIADKPIKTVARGMTLATLGLLIRYLFDNNDNPHYENLTEYTKDNNYLIPNVLGKRDANGYPTTFIKLPKDRQMGVLLVSTVERFARWADGEDAESAFADLGENIIGSFKVDPEPFWSAVRSISTNKNFFNGDIVPMYMQGEAAPDQKNAQTSVISEAISERLYDMGVEVSPMMLDYLIEQYGGSFYGQVLTSATAEDSGGLGRTVGNVASSMFVADPLYSSGAVSRFYDKMDEAQALSRKAEREREQSGIGSFKTADEQGYETLQDYKKDIAALRKQEREILATERDTPARKRKIDDIRSQINDVANEGLAAWDRRS